MASYSRSTSTITAPKSGYKASGAPELWNSRYGEASQYLQGLGKQELLDLLAQFQGLRSQTQQQVMGQGLQATTIMPSLNRGILREQTSAIGNLNDRVARERLDTMTAYTQGEASARQAESAAKAQAGWNSVQAMQDAQRMGLQQAQMIRQNQQQTQARYVKPRNGTRMVQSSYINPGSLGSYQNRYSRI